MSKTRNYTPKETDASISRCFLITPNDSTDLVEFPMALRVWNSNSTSSTISLQTVAGDDIVVTIPPSSLVIEPIHTARVLLTGTSTGLIIHGYL
jgi:hypothetical protein